MYKTVAKVEGMMCGHCEAHVNDVVRNSFDVKKVTSSHSKGETEILSEKPIDGAKLTEKITETGYKVLSVKSAKVEKKGFSLFGKK